MPKLILSMDGLVLKEIALDQPRITIGRKTNNDIQIDNLAISGQHAAVAVIAEDAFLEDLNSTNGTYVNGQAIKKYVLQDNDVIEMGKYRLKFIRTDSIKDMAVSDSSEPVPHDFAAVAAPASETGYRAQPDSTRAPDVAWAEPVAEPPSGAGPDTGAGTTAIVRLLSGANIGREVPLDRPHTRLGRPKRQVAVISRESDGYFIAHAEGTVYPVVNGVMIDTRPRKLKDHDMIEIAGTLMEFVLCIPKIPATQQHEGS